MTTVDLRTLTLIQLVRGIDTFGHEAVYGELARRMALRIPLDRDRDGLEQAE